VAAETVACAAEFLDEPHVYHSRAWPVGSWSVRLESLPRDASAAAQLTGTQ